MRRHDSSHRLRAFASPSLVLGQHDMRLSCLQSRKLAQERKCREAMNPVIQSPCTCIVATYFGIRAAWDAIVVFAKQKVSAGEKLMSSDISSYALRALGPPILVLGQHGAKMSFLRCRFSAAEMLISCDGRKHGLRARSPSVGRQIEAE